MVELVETDIRYIRANWPFISDCMQAVINKCGLNFSTEDVYREITEHKSDLCLFAIRDFNGVDVGFTVVRTFTDRFSQDFVLSLDLTGILDDAPHIDEFRVAIDALARDLGADRIEWHSPRVGWHKIMDRIGYTAGTVCFSREVDYG